MIYPYVTGDTSSAPLPKETAKSSVSQGVSWQKDRSGRIDGHVPVLDPKNSFSAIFSAKSADLATITSGISEQANVPEITIPAPMEEKEESFGFFDFLDIINPLQHIPIVGTIYRHITGDEIGVVAQVAGGALFGGAIGAAAGVATAAIEHQTGKDIGSAFMDAFRSPSSIESGLDGTTIAIMDMKSRERTYNN
ncbi:MAG: hypothetical protein KDJ50_05340 [Alphaproteobacteria bacterium]|nr:hypothetical protein [Alphaproteobacteria bacterium]